MHLIFLIALVNFGCFGIHINNKENTVEHIVQKEANKAANQINDGNETKAINILLHKWANITSDEKNNTTDSRVNTSRNQTKLQALVKINLV